MIKQIETSSCETRYNVDGIAVRLWVIVGGTPAISFDDFSFSHRFDSLEKYSDKHWLRGESRYDHQDPNNIQGITFDDLPKGEQSIHEYIANTLDMKELNDNRYQSIIDLLRGGKCTSKRKHDKDNSTYVNAEWSPRVNGVSPVTFYSGCYGGRCDEKIELFNDWWKKMQSIVNPIFDESYKDGNMGRWCDLTNEQYLEIKNHLIDFKP